jgi:signal peptidase I
MMPSGDHGKVRTRRLRLIVGILLLIPACAAAMYIVNPLGVPSRDPRGRVLGIIPYRMPGVPMAPTVREGSVIIVCTGPSARRTPGIGDIVAFGSPAYLGATALSRIVGLEGDTLEFRDQALFRNGQRQAEPFAWHEEPAPDIASQRVPRGHVFVAGDNRTHSNDSRFIGPVPVEAIVGRLCNPFEG